MIPVLEKIPNLNSEENSSNSWRKLPRKIGGVLGVAAIAMNPTIEILAQDTSKDTLTEYYTPAEFKHQKEQIMSHATGNLVFYTSITERIQNKLTLLKDTEPKKYRLFQKELEKGKEYSIITNKNTIPYEVVHVLVGAEGKVLGTIVQQNEGQTMRSFIDVDGDGMIDRTIVDTDPIADIREKGESVRELAALDVHEVAEKFTDTERNIYFPRHLVITDFSLSESVSEIISVDYGYTDRPVGTKQSSDDTLGKILEKSGQLHAGLAHATDHLDSLTEEKIIAGPLVSR